jgi:mono/diheme cytochrome c family protein
MSIRAYGRFAFAVSTFAGFLGAVQAASAADASRGEMLYSTHCIACHTTHVHWRDKRLASDWASLEKQVRRWQHNTGLSWSNEDVAAVTRYLNTLYYHFPTGSQEKEISRAETGSR